MFLGKIMWRIFEIL